MPKANRTKNKTKFSNGKVLINTEDNFLDKINEAITVIGITNQISIINDKKGSSFPTENESDIIIVGNKPINQIGKIIIDMTLNTVIAF